MPRRIVVVLLVLFAVPALVRAQDVPEKILGAGTQVYVRWDGIESHKADYEKLALGKMLKGDTGKFIKNVYDQFNDLLGGAIVQQLLDGTPPEKLQQIQADALKGAKLVEVLGENGFLLGAEAIGLDPPNLQVTLIFPNASTKADSVFATIRLAAAFSKLEIKDNKIEGRNVQTLQGPVPISWWVEGKHVVVTGGTLLPNNIITRIEKGPSLLENPLYKRVTAFKEFPTGARAFIDLASLNKLAGTRGKEVVKILDDLGVSGLNSLTFYSGFDGPAEQGLMELDMNGPAKGMVKLIAGKPFQLGDVPPLPHDTTSWLMTNFDTKLFYDETLTAAEAIMKLVLPDNLEQFKAVQKELDEGLGVNLRKDILAHLGDRVVQYNASAEGPLLFGQCVLIQVKDEAKLREGLDAAIKGLGKRIGVDVTQKKRMYRDVELREINVKQQGFIFVPTYAIHKGWLAIAAYPQPVQGFILRSNGELPAWKPDEATKDALGKLPKEFVSISVSDPRPGVKQLLSIAPLIAGAANSGLPESKIEVGLIPNAYEATKHLFPNVSVASVKGNTLRFETRASLAMPLDLGNSDTMAIVPLFALFAFRAANK